MAREPELVERLEVVAGNGLAFAGSALGEERRAALLEGGPGGRRAGSEVERRR